jgi:hypothetical protein
LSLTLAVHKRINPHLYQMVYTLKPPGNPFQKPIASPYLVVTYRLSAAYLPPI